MPVVSELADVLAYRSDCARRVVAGRTRPAGTRGHPHTRACHRGAHSTTVVSDERGRRAVVTADPTADLPPTQRLILEVLAAAPPRRAVVDVPIRDRVSPRSRWTTSGPDAQFGRPVCPIHGATPTAEPADGERRGRPPRTVRSGADNRPSDIGALPVTIHARRMFTVFSPYDPIGVDRCVPAGRRADLPRGAGRCGRGRQPTPASPDHRCVCPTVLAGTVQSGVRVVVAASGPRTTAGAACSAAGEGEGCRAGSAAAGARAGTPNRGGVMALGSDHAD